jgi:glycosyltransferase involved in cell wall biosynthesis
MINILVFFTFDTSLETWKKSGIFNREIKYYEKITKNNHIKVTFFTYGNELDHQILKKNNSSLELITLFDKSKINNKFLKFFYSLFFIINNSKKFKNFDIYKSNQNFGSWLPVLCKFFYKKKLISRCGYDLFHFALLERRPIKIFFSYIICYFIYKSANLIFVPTEFYEKFIKKFFFINPKKIKKLPNFIDTNLFKKINNNKRYKKRILFIGRMEKQKNIYNMALLFKKSQYQLDILGKGSLKNKIINFSQKNNCNINFINTSHENHNLPNFINNYDYFILISKYEGNPKVLLEAMSCNLCPLTSDVVGINNIIKDKKNGLIISTDNISKIDNFLNGISLHDIHKMQINARETIIKNNKIETIIKLEQKYIFNLK